MKLNSRARALYVFCTEKQTEKNPFPLTLVWNFFGSEYKFSY